MLKVLSKEEFLRFGKFLKSPFFNYSPSLIQLYHALKRHHPEFDSPRLQAEKLWTRVFPDKVFAVQKFRQLCSDLSRLVEQYLIQLELERPESKAQHLLIQSLGRRNAYTLFEKETTKQLAKLQEGPYRDVEYYSAFAKLTFDHHFHTLTKKYSLQDEKLETLMDCIDMQFILAKLRVGSECRNRENILKKKYDIRFLGQVLREGKAGYMKENLSSELYRLLFQLYEYKSEQHVFFSLKKLLTKQIQNLRYHDQSLLLSQLINYTIQQINKGDTAFYKEALELYQLGLTNDLILENQRIDEAVYGNITLLGCHAQDFEWTIRFIEEYEPYLEKTIRADAKALNKGTWYFHQKDFENAYHLFLNHKFSHNYQPKTRLFLIKTLYEQFLFDETLFDVLNAQLDSFEIFLHRSKVFTTLRKKANLNCIRIIRRLVAGIYQNKDSNTLKQSLLNQVNKKERLTGKRWLTQKINQLI